MSEVSLQAEHEAAALLFVALRPLSPTARARVVSFVNSQLTEIDGPQPKREDEFVSFMDFWGRK